MQAGLRVYQACEVLAVHRSYVGDAKLDKMLSWHTKRWALRERGYDCFGSLARPALADATAAFSFEFRVHNRLLLFADPLIFAGVYFNYPTDRNSIAASTFIAVTEKNQTTTAAQEHRHRRQPFGLHRLSWRRDRLSSCRLF
jgi:hypothetical protein